MTDIMMISSARDSRTTTTTTTTTSPNPSSSTTWRVSPQKRRWETSSVPSSSTLSSPPNVAAGGETASIDLGMRLAIYWDGEDEFFAGTVTNTKKNGKLDLYFVEYDDGDKEWVDLTKETYQILVESKKKQQPNKNTNSQDRPWLSSAASSQGSTVNTQTVSMSQHQEQQPLPPLKKAKQPLTTTDTTIADWVSASVTKHESDSETDDEEIMQWAVKMFGIAPQPILATRKSIKQQPQKQVPQYSDLHENIYIPISEAVKLGRRRRSSDHTEPMSPTVCRKGTDKSASCAMTVVPPSQAGGGGGKEIDEEKRQEKLKRESARPLTTTEIKALWAQDSLECNGCSQNWVRRSVRLPSRSTLHSPQVKALVEKLKTNDTDMIVLKTKKYINDPATPQIVIDAVLDALEENTNSEALYIQNFNEGMRDEQVLRLLHILKLPSCKIWCLNIGETYKVKTSTWKAFADGLADTKITHMYASEHTITSQLKEQIRSSIRDNRSKHTMHNDPENLDTIIQCTHCWWNPINAKNLRPYLKKKGYEHILHDKEFQGLRGTHSGGDGPYLT